ncbi:MAG: type II secretion system protein GspD [Sedimentisphaerales bacterium]|nr:type II secretion system protein GspD [Sedimentisphaerales bacterium]
MNKSNKIKLITFSLLIAMIWPVGMAYSASEDITQTIEETIGKADPFKAVVPVVETKKVYQPMADSSPAMPVNDVYKPDLYVETVMLQFLKAENVESIASNLVSVHGTVSVDEETNSIIICDDFENLSRAVEQVRKADQTPRQIWIEVVIVDVQVNDETEIGINWTNLLGTPNTTVGTPGIPAGFGDHDRSFTQSLIPTTLTGGATFNIIHENIGISLQALQQVREVEILSTPTISVLSGQEAYIKTVEEIPYTEASNTSEGGSLTSTEFKEAGITLTVKAIITDEGMILLTLEPEQSVNTGTNTITNSTVPVVDSRSAKTTLLMNDGEVLVLGGLRKKEIRISEDKVPLLGDIPLIGALFSDDKTEIKNSELLVFVSPHIKNKTLKEDQKEKYEELRNKPILKLSDRKPNEKNPLGILNWFE